jgi:hypothetical protein
VRYEEIECDIVVAGGSTAALAASLAAARTAPEKRICLLESTNWPGLCPPSSSFFPPAQAVTDCHGFPTPGGQLTSSAVSAVDFGNHNVHPVNQPKVRAHALFSLTRLLGGT